MKRSLIFSMIFSILILTACLSPSGGVSAPTVTATQAAPTATKTATATETPSPESLLPQEVKEKFELAGIDPANMENAKYDKDGLHITLESGEVIVLTNTDLQNGIYNGQDNVLQYRDEANQNVIYAFDKETGKWMITPEGQLDLDLKRWGITPEKYNVGYDKEGKIELREKGTNRLVYWDGKWSSDVIVKLVEDSGRCEPTPYVWSVGANGVDREQEYDFTQYMIRLFGSVSFFDNSVRGHGSRSQPIGKGGESDICWGMWLGGNHFEETIFAWRDVDDEVHVEQVFRK